MQQMARVEDPGRIAGPSRLPALGRYLFSGGLAGVVSGVVFLGVGSRLAMRVSALFDPGAEGLRTENGNIVGEITASGTIGLMLFAGLFGGLITGFLWVLVREWLPAAFRPRVAAAGLLAALLGSFMVVSTENRDFGVLNPPEANVAMFVLIVGLTGCGAAALDQRLERVLPSGLKASLSFSVLALLGAALSLPIVAQAFLSEDFCGCHDPPSRALPFIAIAGVATVFKWTQASDRGEPPWLRPLGIIGVLGAAFSRAQICWPKFGTSSEAGGWG